MRVNENPFPLIIMGRNMSDNKTGF
jgi:hypothetical protein